MYERKITVICAFDVARKEMWYVDSREKLTRRLQHLSLAIPPMTLGDLKALVYDTERKDKQDCVVDVDDWYYHSRRARGLAKGLFAQELFPDRPNV